ncbi:MFS transporter [Staphylococcus succinus]|uniref:MFS transporter n=1 Tax=Staphylococcus succinus TaxID=61015 RepID=UPI000D1FB571|nr:MFS transporter [Staphylococcus succinus]PTJ18117.1 MFS transporter [Staphylococcus succinus]PTJ80829.1 MFS transporter [Staphylococcus succinus]
MFKIFLNFNFRCFFLAEIISAFGVGISTVGANWYLIDKTNDAHLLGIMLSLNVLAGFLASPIIGGVADNYNRKNIIMLTYIFQVILYIIIVTNLIIYGFHTYLIISFAVVNGIGWTTYMATSRSLVKQILSPEEYPPANSLLEISLQTGMFTAGGLAGILYQFQGFTLITGITITTFLVSIFILLRMKVDKPNHTKDSDNLIKEYLKGWKFLKKNKVLFVFGVISIIPMVFTMIFNVSLPSYVTNTLKLTSIEFGLSDMFYGIGGLAAGIFSAVIIKKIPIKTMIFSLFLLLVLNSIAFISIQSAIYLFIGSFVLGYSISSIRIYMNTAIMNSISDEYTGRAFTIWASLSLLMQSFISPILGKGVDKLGDDVGFIIILIASLIIIILLIFINRSKEILYNDTGDMRGEHIE